MKKLVSILLLTFGVCTLSLHCMEEREKNNIQSRAEEPKEQDSFIYTIKCADNKKLEIDKLQFDLLKNNSRTITKLFDDINDPSNKKVPLIELSSDVVQNILTILDTLPPLTKVQKYKEYINNLSQQPLTNLIELILAANYLDMQSLLELLSKTIAHKIIKEINQISSGTFSQKVIQWFEQNKNDLQLPAELLNMIALHIAKQTSVPTFIPQSLIKDYKDTVSCFALSPQGSYLIAGSPEGTIKIWNYNKNEKKFELTSQVLTGHAERISHLAFSPDESYFVSGSVDFKIKVWTKNKDNNQWTSSLETTHLFGSIDYLAISPDSSYFIEASNETSTIKVHTYVQEENTWTVQLLTDHTTPIRRLAISPDSSYFISGDCTKYLRIWTKNTTTNQWTSKLLTGNTSFINCLTFSPGGSYLLAGLMNKTIKVWTNKCTVNENQWMTSQMLNKHNDVISCFAISPNGSFFISGSNDKTIRVWTKNNENQWDSQMLTGHRKAIKYLAISPDGSFFISAAWDNTIRVWTKNADSDQWTSQTLIGNSPHFINLAISHDGSFFISGCGDNNTYGSISKSINIQVWTKINYNNITFEQALLFLIWQQAKKDNVSFEIPQELQTSFDDLPEDLKNFLNANIDITKEEEPESFHRLF